MCIKYLWNKNFINFLSFENMYPEDNINNNNNTS
jgi:hypothetical protein